MPVQSFAFIAIVFSYKKDRAKDRFPILAMAQFKM